MSVHQALQRIRETLKLHINLPKTLYFNFKVFDFRQAVRLPVFLYGKVDLDALHRGCVELSSKVRTGDVKFGGGWYTELYGYSQRHKSFLRIEGKLVLGMILLSIKVLCFLLVEMLLCALVTGFDSVRGLCFIQKKALQ